MNDFHTTADPGRRKPLSPWLLDKGDRDLVFAYAGLALILVLLVAMLLPVPADDWSDLNPQS